MSASIKEALRAWRSIDEYLEGVAQNGDLCGEEEISEARGQRTCVTTALEAAAQEAEAWEAIEKWRKQYPARECWLLLVRHGFYRCSLQDVRNTPADHRGSKHFEGPSRLEALEAAAKWCRAELAK